MIIPELITGGAQRSFSQLSVDLAKDHEVEIVIFNQLNPVQYAVGGRLHSLNVAAGFAWPGKAWALWARVRNLKKIKRSFKPDASISFLEGADYVNVLSSIGEKVILSVRGSKSIDLDIRGALGWIRRKWLIPLIYNHADLVVCVSAALRTELMTDYHVDTQKLVVIHNYYDIHAIESRSRHELPEPFAGWLTDEVLIHVGRLHQQKNQTLLIQAFSASLSTKKHKLVIVGDGPMREQLLKHSEELKLRTYSVWRDKFNDGYDIYFLGEQSNPLPFMRRAAAFVLTSVNEGFPNVLVEAMICDLPILSSDCDGAREILQPTEDVIAPAIGRAKYGLIVKALPGRPSVENWSMAMTTMLNSSDLLKSYALLGPVRAVDFEKSNVLASWSRVVESSKL